MAEEFEDGMSIYTNIGSMFSSNQALSSTFDRKKKKRRKKKKKKSPGGTGSEPTGSSDAFDVVEDSGASSPSLLTGAVQLLDEAVVESGSKRVLETYDMIKSMMEMWNPQASRWAANASATYK